MLNRFKNHLLIDALYLVYPTLAAFSFAQFNSFNQISSFAIINYILTILTSAFIITIIIAMAYKIYLNKNKPKKGTLIQPYTAGLVAEYK